MSTTDRPTFDAARQALRTHFGYADFRGGQEEIVRSILDGRDTLAVLPTGGGKSICYQIPALLLDGITIVVSPLISLMQDQVEALRRARIRATFVNSMLDFRDAMERIEQARRGLYKLMYVAPERFESPAFLDRMRGARVALFAVDEAHCISEWGHDFRPSYLKLREAIEFLGTPQIAALTATATPDVREDVVRQLALRQPSVIVRGFNRPNLSLRVKQGTNKREAILAACAGDSCGIVYAGTRNAVEEIADMLRRHGIVSEAYHAGLPDTRRKEVQERFMRGDARVIVATTAFGMGIDKPDVRFVIHHDMPGSIEQYYQEAGRAGRDGKPSVCTILHQPGDRSLPEFFIRQTFPDRALVQNVYAFLHATAGNQLGQSFRGLVNLNPQQIAGGIGKTSEAAVRGALDLLDRSGYVRRIDASYAHSTVRFIVEPDQLREWLVREASDTLSPVAVALLRTVGSEAFFHPVDVFLNEIAEKTFRSEDHILQGLREMQAQGLVEFQSGRKGSGYALFGERVQARDLTIDYRALEKRMAHAFEKLRAMERYILGVACRRNMILEYFQETDINSVCGICDSCESGAEVAPPPDDEDRFEALAPMVLECVAELEGKFGRSVLIDVLRGSKSKRIAEYGLQRATAYGRASTVERGEISAVLDAMIGLGWIGMFESVRPALRLTELGRAKLTREITPLEISPGGSDAELRDPVLYESLRAARRRIAGELRIPSHMLVADAVLRAVANAAPADMDSLLAVEGIGPVTAKRIGTQLLATIREHLRERELALAVSREQRALPDLPSSIVQTFELCVQKLPLQDIAARRGLTDGTVSQHIAEMIGKGIRIDIDALLPNDHQRQIRTALGKLPRADLKKVKSLVDPEISFAEIRIVLAIVERERRVAT